MLRLLHQRAWKTAWTASWSWCKTEGLLFKYGSGTGTNFSRLRASRERLSGGGTASGPVSFMRGFDSFAGVIKSGGKTRRAAKMVILDADHPDILEFIRSKAEEERKAWALTEAGLSAGFNVPGGAYDSVQFQNANHSVRVPDAFMRAAAGGEGLDHPARMDGRPMGTYKAADLLDAMAEAAWVCGDPGLQFDTTINRWHTCPESGRINASNPCSEYMFLDDSRLQPGLPQPHAIPRAGRPARGRSGLRRGRLPARRGHHHAGPGNPGGPGRLSHRGHRPQLPGFPAPGPGLCQPGGPAHVPRPAL